MKDYSSTKSLRFHQYLSRYEEAIKAYAFKGTFYGPLKAEVIEEYHQAKKALFDYIEQYAHFEKEPPSHDHTDR